MKRVIITNGYARSGKDEFAKILNDYIGVSKYSSIDCVRNGAREAGWYSGGKSDNDRKFLSDLKKLLTDYNDVPFRDLKCIYDDFINELYYPKSEILIFDIREPDEIERAVKEFNAITVFIKKDNIMPVTSNSSDANVENYNYDYYVENNGTLDDFRDSVRTFYLSLIEK